MVLGEKSEDNALLSSALCVRNSNELPWEEAWLEQSVTYCKMYTLGGLSRGGYCYRHNERIPHEMTRPLDGVLYNSH